ncbi:DUF998 domain-containing protein [Vibrio nigripulchritudo]|uniref:DUF998 domain-containing protein n=1 Tax=Vibrio nigripulchritudo TaxID=28173 RepID=UPI00190B1EF3|nr:DUF998 domain-containing protein [Vibrio nigripulchritudo]
MNSRYLLLALPIFSFTWFTSTVFIAGYFYPDYSHISQFISELGATGAPHGAYVNYLGFIPTELFILGFVFVSYSVIPRTKLNTIGLIFIAIYGITLGIAAFFPCDFECRPDTPSISHNIHMASAFPGYLCGVMAIFCLSSGSTSWSNSKVFKFTGYTAAIVALLAFLSLDPSSKTVGLNQRILELTIYAWLIFLGYSLSEYLHDTCEPSLRHNR